MQDLSCVSFSAESDPGAPLSVVPAVITVVEHRSSVSVLFFIQSAQIVF